MIFSIWDELPGQKDNASGRFSSLIGVPLVSHAKQLLGEAPLLLVIEACKEGLRGIGELLLIDGALAHIIGSPAHLFDDVDGALLLRAIGSQRDLAVSLLFADVAHGALEAG